MLRADKDPPTFEDTGFAVRVLFPGGIGNDAFVRFIADLPDALARDVDVLLALSRLERRAPSRLVIWRQTSKGPFPRRKPCFSDSQVMWDCSSRLVEPRAVRFPRTVFD
jgi:hypothetical protein